MSYQTPLRTPVVADEPLMRRRAWWLIVLNFLIPGLPQILTGSKRLGRLGVCMWLVGIAAVIAAVWVSRTNVDVLAGIITNAWALFALQVVIVAVAAFWIILTIDTFRRAKLRRVRVESRIALSIVTTLALIAGVFGAGLAVQYVGTARALLSDLFGDSTEAVTPVDGRYNFVLLGADSGDGREGMRPDSMSVVSVDAETGHAAIIGIPRDLYPIRLPASSPLKGKYPLTSKANGVYTFVSVEHPDLYPDIDDPTGFKQGMQAVKEEASGITGLQVQFYVLVDMQGFADIVDALGGVDIDVKQHLDFVDGPDNAHVYHGSVEPGLQHMDGQTALWYARSRKTTSDWDRMERQRQLQEALIQQFTPVTLLTRFQEIAKASPEFVQTDIPRGGLGQFVKLADKSRSQSIETLELTPPDFPEHGLDWDQVDAAVADVIAHATGQQTS